MAVKKLLYEVSVIRVITIFLLVVLHAFTIYGGGWSLPDNVEPVSAYWWLAHLISGFRIEAIAMVAGYVFAYQVLSVGKDYSLHDFVKLKLKRLIVPMLFFGLIYYFLFRYQAGSFHVGFFLLDVLSGPGHLWFLPMLFWCFIGGYFIWRYKLSEKILFIVLSLVSICPCVWLPFGLSKALFFMVYFYTGFLLWKYKERVLATLSNRLSMLLLVVVYFGGVFLQLLVLPDSSSENTIWGKLVVIAGSRSLQYLVAMSGILALYVLVCRYVQRHGSPQQWVLWANSICYGVYIFHQFILLALYYHTKLPLWVDSYALPWVGLCLTLVGSIGATVLFLRTKFGRYLIG